MAALCGSVSRVVSEELLTKVWTPRKLNIKRLGEKPITVTLNEYSWEILRKKWYY